jgi:hypothetical protein
MLVITGLVVLVIAIVIFAVRRMPGSIDPAQLGFVSQQWLAEYRASHPS